MQPPKGLMGGCRRKKDHQSVKRAELLGGEITARNYHKHLEAGANTCRSKRVKSMINERADRVDNRKDIKKWSGTTKHLSMAILAPLALRLRRQLITYDTAPTAAELTTSFGAVGTVGAGFVGVVNDAAGGTNFYIVASDGTSFFTLR